MSVPPTSLPLDFYRDVQYVPGKISRLISSNPDICSDICFLKNMLPHPSPFIDICPDILYVPSKNISSFHSRYLSGHTMFLVKTPHPHPLQTLVLTCVRGKNIACLSTLDIFSEPMFLENKSSSLCMYLGSWQNRSSTPHFYRYLF